jgi:hypothetical protein
VNPADLQVMDGYEHHKTIAEKECGKIAVHLASVPGQLGLAYLQLSRLRNAIDELSGLAPDETDLDRRLKDSRYAKCARLLSSAMRCLERS